MATSLAKKAIEKNRGKVALFVTNQVSLHDHQPQKIDGKTYNFSTSQIPNLDCHVATMTIPLKVSVPLIVADTWISRCRFKAQIQEVLVESAVPGKRCLLETIEGTDEVVDIFWMLLALETFSLRNVDVLIEECLKKGIVNIH